MGRDTKIVVLVNNLRCFRSVGYFLKALLPEWEKDGREVAVVDATSGFVEAAAAILHVDLTVVPEAYLSLIHRYRVTINAGTVDISKRCFSQNLVRLEDDYDGPVIVKTDRNAGGIPERVGREESELLGRILNRAQRYLPWRLTRWPHPIRYPIYDTPRSVPDFAWRSDHLIVEKFRPERENGNYCLRVWVFFGDRESNRRSVSTNPIVKATDTDRHEALPHVPEELRRLRRRLGFDYGKFDYVINDGEPVIFDVNRTPITSMTRNSSFKQKLAADLAKGLRAFL